jgi:hypothetical protein
VSGGTTITIRGANFGSGAAVTIGGLAAVDVLVQSADAMTARTPASTISGTVDVAVTVNGRTGTLTGAFRYEPAPPNTPPVIKSITAQGTRARQPANLADYGELIQMTAVVDDADTPDEALEYRWQACGGLFIGTGRQLQWQAPSTALSPPACIVELIVSDGPNVATKSIEMSVHDSPAEVAALALEFLTEFADSSIPAASTVRNFSDSCKGKAEEQEQVAENRKTRIINSHEYGTPATKIDFGGVCAFRARSADACIATPVEWRSTIIKDGKSEVAKGTSYITGIYASSRWWLCQSEWQGTTSSGLKFMD